MTENHQNIVNCSESIAISMNSMPMDKLTFQELVDRHPLLTEKGWGINELTIFMKTGFIRAEIREEDDILLIDEASVFELIDIHDAIITSRIVDLEVRAINRQKG